MKALLLLGGQSSRFWPLVEKPLFPIAGKPLMAHIVDRLRKGGCDDVVFVGSANNLEEIRTLYPDATLVEQENAKAGMRGALLSALPACGGSDVLVVGGNDIVDPSAYAATIAEGKKRDGGAILGQTVTRYFPGGYLSVEGEKIVGIVEKPGAGNEPSDLVNIVCHYHKDASVLLAALAAIDDATDDGYGYEKALDGLFKRFSYGPVRYDGAWNAIKFPWHVLDALPGLLGANEPRIDPAATVHPTAVVEGNVVLEAGVKVFPHATVKGPCYVGKGTVIGNGALVRNASVGDHCVIGYNTEVQASVLHSHVWTHSTYLGDSVIGRNVSFGAGTVTGNLRLDEGEIQSVVKGEKMGTGRTKFGAVIGNDCRVGIHVSTNPGIKIGARSLVAGHLMVDRDLEEESYARFKDGALAVAKNTARIPDPADREKYLQKA